MLLLFAFIFFCQTVSFAKPERSCVTKTPVSSDTAIFLLEAVD